MFIQQGRTHAEVRRNMWQVAIQQSLQTDTSAPAWRPEHRLSEEKIAELLRGRRFEDAPEARAAWR